MKKLKIVLGIIMGCFFPFSLGAQLSLDDCQRLAEQNYPLLKKYDLISQTTSYTVKNIQQGYLPKIAARGQASLQTAVPTLPGMLDNLLATQGYVVKGLKKDQYHVGVDVNQLVWDGGKIEVQKRMAAERGRVETLQNDVKLYALRTRINELYFGLLWLNEQINLNGQYQILLQRNKERLQVLRDKGMVMQADVDAVAAEFLKAAQQTRSLEAMQNGLREVLALFVAKETTDLMVLQKPPVSSVSMTENHRPELGLFEAQRRQVALRTSLLQRARYPQISLFAEGGYGYPGLDFFDDMFTHDWKWSAKVGVRLQWSLSSFYTQKQERRKIALDGAQLDNNREVFLFNHQLRATQEQAEMNRYRKMLSEDDEIIRLRTSVREAAEARLSKGVIDVVQLLQEITKENQARTERSEHEIEMLKHLYELKFTLNQ